MSLSLSNVEYTKTNDDVSVDNTNEYDSDYEDELPLYQCEKGKNKYLQYTLSSITPLIIFLVMLFVGSSHKLLRMFLYRIKNHYVRTSCN